MLEISSPIEGKQVVYGDIQKHLEKEGFVLGDNWEYDAGFLDSVLNQKYDSTLFLRIPFEVVQGELDDANAVLQMGRPFLLKHVVQTGYSEGNTENPTYDPYQMGYLVNQFQEPKKLDAEIENEDYWVSEAKSRLERIAHLFS